MTNEQEQIERAAKALHERIRERIERSAKELYRPNRKAIWEYLCKEVKDEYRSDAQAIIDAYNADDEPDRIDRKDLYRRVELRVTGEEGNEPERHKSALEAAQLYVDAVLEELVTQEPKPEIIGKDKEMA